MSSPSAQQTSSLSFTKAVEKFTSSLPAKQKADFAHTTLEDVHDAIQGIQQRRGHEGKLRNMAKLQSFLEAMDQYRKVIEQFQNCTPFLGFVWGSIKFVLLIADTWVRSLDIILGAYNDIGERLPSFIKYRALFENDLELRKALESYFCDILEFHFHALKFLNRPKWEKLFDSSWKTFDTQFQRILDSLARHKSLIESEKGTLTFLEAQKAREIAEFQAKGASQREAEEKLKVLTERLAPTDFSRDQYDASQQRRQGNTGNWLLQNEDFKRWVDLDVDCNQLLYINGIPGSGKTVLSSLLIEWLSKKGHAPLLYFFCKHDRPGKNRYTDILSALVAQFAQQDRALAGYLHDICVTKDRLGILEVLETLADTAFESHTSCCVVIDGLDECGTDEAEKIMSWLILRQKASESAGSYGIRLLFVGQRTSMLTRLLATATSISLDVPEHHADIRRYVEDTASKIQDEFGLDDFVRTQIIHRVTNVAKSMFLYAKLVMENLQSQVTQEELLRELEPAIFPVDLDDAYHRICETVLKEGPQKKVALHIIRHIVCAARSLKWREIQASFYIGPKENASYYAGRKLRKDCKQLCRALVDLRKDEDDPESEAVLDLVHETARSYLIRKGLIDASLCHFSLTIFCLDYLLSSPLALSASDEELKKQAQNGYYAFHDYASIHWFDHLSKLTKSCDIKNDDWWADLSSRCGSFAETFDASNPANFSSEIASLSQIKAFVDSIPTGARNRNVHYDVGWRTSRIRSAIEGLLDEHQNDEAHKLALEIYGVRPFKCRKVDCPYYFDGFRTKNERDHHNDRHDRPYKCVQSECPFQNLGFETPNDLERHIKANHSTTEDDCFTFPVPPKKQNDDLCRAAARGDVVAITNLLDKGSNMNQTTRKLGGLTPLILATRNSHLKIVRLLLQHGADVNFQGPVGSSKSTAFHYAVEKSSIEILQELLAISNADPNRKDINEFTPLLIACQKGCTVSVKLLLNSKKVNVNYSCSVCNVLSVSPWSDNLMDLLMSHISTDSARSMLFQFTDVKDMDSKFFKLILPHMHDKPWNLDYNDDHSILQIAVLSDAWAMAHFLIDSGKFDLSMKDANDETALHWLVSYSNGSPKGHQKLREDLFKAILKCNYVDADYVSASQRRTPLSLAVNCRQTGIVRFLLETGKVNVNHVDNEGLTPLSYALENQDSEVVELLLATGKIDVRKRDSEIKKFISRAIEAQKLNQIEWLFNGSCADPNTGKAVIEIPPDEVERLEIFIKDYQSQPREPREPNQAQVFQAQLEASEQMRKIMLQMARQEQDTRTSRSP